MAGVNTDVLLLLEVSRLEERETFAEALHQTVNLEDSAFRLLQAFTRHPITTTDALRSATAGRTCFTELHLGLDISRTYYANGVDHHPNGVNLSRPDAQELVARYRRFQGFLWEALGLSAPAPWVLGGQGAEKVTVIERRQSRRLVNVPDVLLAARVALPGAEVEVAALENMTFSRQLQVGPQALEHD
jgi:hypothetical protein